MRRETRLKKAHIIKSTAPTLIEPFSFTRQACGLVSVKYYIETTPMKRKPQT